MLVAAVEAVKYVVTDSSADGVVWCVSDDKK